MLIIVMKACYHQGLLMKQATRENDVIWTTCITAAC